MRRACSISAWQVRGGGDCGVGGSGRGDDRDRTAAKKAATGPLAGKTLVVTGTLEKYSREEIQELIAKHGGRAASSVSKSTDYLVAGEKAGSKLEKAQKLGVKVITEEEFEALVEGGVRAGGDVGRKRHATAACGASRRERARREARAAK